jgi:hypothetical protein
VVRVLVLHLDGKGLTKLCGRTQLPVVPRVGLDIDFIVFASERSRFQCEDFGTNRCLLGRREGVSFPG